MVLDSRLVAVEFPACDLRVEVRESDLWVDSMECWCRDCLEAVWQPVAPSATDRQRTAARCRWYPKGTGTCRDWIASLRASARSSRPAGCGRHRSHHSSMPHGRRLRNPRYAPGFHTRLGTCRGLGFATPLVFVRRLGDSHVVNQCGFLVGWRLRVLEVVHKSQHMVDGAFVVLGQGDLILLRFLWGVSQLRFRIVTSSERSTYVEVSLKHSFEDLGIVAQLELVDLPFALTTDDGEV